MHGSGLSGGVSWRALLSGSPPSAEAMSAGAGASTGTEGPRVLHEAGLNGGVAWIASTSRDSDGGRRRGGCRFASVCSVSRKAVLGWDIREHRSCFSHLFFCETVFYIQRKKGQCRLPGRMRLRRSPRSIRRKNRRAQHDQVGVHAGMAYMEVTGLCWWCAHACVCECVRAQASL